MSFATCKYDRELKFIWSRLNYLQKTLDSGNLPEAKRKEMEKEFEFLAGRNEEISQTYIDSGMKEYLVELKTKCSTPPLDFDNFDIGPCKNSKKEESDNPHPMMEISSINEELSELDDALVRAQLNGDADECKKIEMSVATLKSRRFDLIEQMKSADEEGEEEEETDASVYNEDLEELKKDIASLRTQLGMLRNDVMDLKGAISQMTYSMGDDRR